MNNSNQCLTTSVRCEIDKEVLEFCLIEVQKIQYRCLSLEELILPLALKTYFFSLIQVNESPIRNVVNNFFPK